MGHTALVVPPPSPTRLPPSRRTAHRSTVTLAVPEHVRGLTHHIPNTRLFVVPAGGHWLFGQIEEGTSEITQFLFDNLAMVQDSHSEPPATAQR